MKLSEFLAKMARDIEEGRLDFDVTIQEQPQSGNPNQDTYDLHGTCTYKKGPQRGESDS